MVSIILPMETLVALIMLILVQLFYIKTADKVILYQQSQYLNKTSMLYSIFCNLLLNKSEMNVLLMSCYPQ